MGNKKEFLISFQISKLVLFDVDYYTLGSNKNADFSTSAYEFVKNKKDFSGGGQAQERLLPKNSKAYNFYKKWDIKHLNDLTNIEYEEMCKDLEELKQQYNFIEETPTKIHSNISFYNLVELSKQNLKNKKELEKMEV